MLNKEPAGALGREYPLTVLRENELLLAVVEAILPSRPVSWANGVGGDVGIAARVKLGLMEYVSAPPEVLLVRVVDDITCRSNKRSAGVSLTAIGDGKLTTAAIGIAFISPTESVVMRTPPAGVRLTYVNWV